MFELVQISCKFLPPRGSMVLDIFYNLYWMKTHKTAINSATVVEKISTDLESLEFWKFIDVH